MTPRREQVLEKARGTVALPSPSASIILVNPQNEILLLHRVQTSSAFSAAHVFPGGNLSPQGGALVVSGVERHRDNLAYRTGAIRELFEESGILLVRKDKDSKELLSIAEPIRAAGRQIVHSEKVSFSHWLQQQSGKAVLDTDSLIPFTHWITPPNVPKRFTTQMYLYFLPLEQADNASIRPTSDGGKENTAADFARAKHWLQKAQNGEIILFPPQYLLLHLAARFLDESEPLPEQQGPRKDEILSRRTRLRDFIMTDGSPPWLDKYISPVGLGFKKDGRVVLGLDKPGRELEDSGLKGDVERVILVKFQKEGPRQVNVRSRREVLEELRKEGGADEGVEDSTMAMRKKKSSKL